MNNNKVIDAIAPAFTALMIEKIQNLKTGWSKPWVSMAQGCPRNLAGRYYNGGNLFMLLLLTEYKRYKTPIFLTYKQAQDEEINVKKGEKSFPFASCTPRPGMWRTPRYASTAMVACGRG